MKNARRRKEMLILGILLGNAVKVVNLPQFESLKASGPLFMLDGLDERFKAAVVSENERGRELDATKMVVNAILPTDYFKGTDEQKLWFACNVVYELIQANWRVPIDPFEAMFVQGMFDLSQQMGGRITIPEHWEAKAKAAPAKLRYDHGYFG